MADFKVDARALRFGAEAAGWAVLFEWDEPGRDGPELRWDVSNKLFASRDEAEGHARTIHGDFRVTVKALRSGPPFPSKK